MSLKPNKSIITHIEVTFREIDRIFDLLPGSILAAGGARGARRVTDAGLCPGAGLLRIGRGTWCDEAGNDAQGVVNFAPGVYRGVRVTGYAPFLQTFERDKSAPLDRKYLYVYAAQAASKAAGELHCELYFEKGEFQRVPLDQGSGEGQDTRAPAGAKCKRLLLDLISAKGAQQAQQSYYFFLAPYQLPWAAVQELGSSIRARGVRLWDCYYTDIYTTADPASATQIPHATLQDDKPPTMMYSVHLPDPFKEGLGRAQRLAEMLRQWEPEQARLGADRNYLLAMRVRNFARGNPAFAENIDAWKLIDFMGSVDRQVTRLYMLAAQRCNELLRWIGEAQQGDTAGFPGAQGSGHTWVVEGAKVMLLKEKSFNTDWCSPFSNACDDYALAPAATVAEVARIVYRVHEDLHLCASGAGWLSANFDRMAAPMVNADASWSRVERERPPLDTAHGGASILFPAKRKFFQGGSEFSAGLLKFYARSWVQAYRATVLGGVANFLKHVHGIDLETVDSSVERLLLRERAGKQLRRLRRDPRRFNGEPASVKILKLNSVALPFVALAVETVNLDAAFDQWKGDKTSFYNNVNLAGAMIDGYLAVSTIVKTLPNPEIPLYRVGMRAVKFSPLAAVSAAIDVTTASMDLAATRTTDEGVAHGLRVGGAALCLGGTALAETPPGWVLIAAGLVIQAAGTYVVGNLSAASRFLRFCRWGTGSSLLSGDLRDQQDEYWYAGPLSLLAADVEEQHRALDRLLYDFQPMLSVQRDGPDFIVCVQMREEESARLATNLIGPEALWSISVDFYRDGFGDKPVKSMRFGPEACDGFDLTVGGKLPLHTFQWPYRRVPPPLPYATIGPMPPERRTPIWDAPDGSVSVKAEIALDVFGDGSCLVKRSWQDSVNLFLH